MGQGGPSNPAPRRYARSIILNRRRRRRRGGRVSVYVRHTGTAPRPEGSSYQPGFRSCIDFTPASAAAAAAAWRVLAVQPYQPRPLTCNNSSSTSSSCFVRRLRRLTSGASGRNACTHRRVVVVVVVARGGRSRRSRRRRGGGCNIAVVKR